MEQRPYIPAKSRVKEQVGAKKIADLPNSKVVATAWQLRLSQFEKVTIAICTTLFVMLSIGVLLSKGNLTNAQHKLEGTQGQVTSITTKNSTLKQEINQLSDQSTLNKVAKNSGLSYKTNNVRNITK